MIDSLPSLNEQIHDKIVHHNSLPSKKKKCDICNRTYYYIEHNWCPFCVNKPIDYSKIDYDNIDFLLESVYQSEIRQSSNDFVGNQEKFPTFDDIHNAFIDEVKKSQKKSRFVSLPLTKSNQLNSSHQTKILDKATKKITVACADSFKIVTKPLLPLPFVSTNFYKIQKFGSWTLPGRGKKRSGINGNGVVTGCGTFSISKPSIVACPTHYETEYKVLTYSCDRSLCPVCFPKWSWKRAMAAEERFKSFQNDLIKNRLSFKMGDVRHIVVSPPLDLQNLALTEKGFKILKKKAFAIMKKAGFLGGCVVTHPWRIKCKNCNKSFRKCSCKNCDPYWKTGLHFHFLGYGYMQHSPDFSFDNCLNRKKDCYIDDCETCPNSSKWIYKNKGKRDSIAETINYELEHAGLFIKNDKVRFQTLIWLGEMSNAKLRKEVEKETSTIECKICSRDYEKVSNNSCCFDGFSKDEIIDLQNEGFDVNLNRTKIEWLGNPKFEGIYEFKIEIATYYIRNVKKLRQRLDGRKKVKNKIIKKSVDGFLKNYEKVGNLESFDIQIGTKRYKKISN